MSKRKQNETMHDDGTYVVKKSRKKNIIAFILCLLIAVIVWLYASNAELKRQAEEQQNAVKNSACVTDGDADPLGESL